MRALSFVFLCCVAFFAFLPFSRSSSLRIRSSSSSSGAGETVFLLELASLASFSVRFFDARASKRSRADMAVEAGLVDVEVEGAAGSSCSASDESGTADRCFDLAVGASASSSSSSSESTIRRSFLLRCAVGRTSSLSTEPRVFSISSRAREGEDGESARRAVLVLEGERVEGVRVGSEDDVGSLTRSGTVGSLATGVPFNSALSNSSSTSASRAWMFLPRTKAAKGSSASPASPASDASSPSEDAKSASRPSLNETARRDGLALTGEPSSSLVGSVECSARLEVGELVMAPFLAGEVLSSSDRSGDSVRSMGKSVSGMISVDRRSSGRAELASTSTGCSSFFRPYCLTGRGRAGAAVAALVAGVRRVSV